MVKMVQRPRGRAMQRTSARSSEMMLNCFRSSCSSPAPDELTVFCLLSAMNDLRTSSSSAFRCLNLSRWLVTMGRIETSADGAKGMGLLRAGDAYPHSHRIHVCIRTHTHIVESRVSIRGAISQKHTVFFPRSNPANTSGSSDTASKTTVFGLCASICRRSFSNFSFSARCFSSSDEVMESSACTDCSDASSSPWRICSEAQRIWLTLA